MRTITLEQANEDLTSHFNYTLNTHKKVNISSSHGAIVMMPQDDYNSMKETLNLLKDKKSLRALLDGHNARDENIEPRIYSVEEVFSDL
jgi:PHD/YefM family antitoxin component YafN of YafNO toxin-antitoxin module